MDNNSQSNNGTIEDMFIHTTVTDELYEEMAELEGLQVMGAALWEDSLSDTDDEEEETPVETPADPEARIFVDLDLYLDENVQLELYEVAIYRSLEDDPIVGLTAIGTLLAAEIEKGLWLEEVAVDEADQLVLLMTRSHDPQLYLNVGGWATSEWDELPDEDE